MNGMSLIVAGENPPSGNAFLGLRLHLIALNSTFLSRPLIHLQEVGWKLDEVCLVNQKRKQMAAALGHPEKLQASSSSTAAKAGTAQHSARPEENTFLPTPNVCGIWGAYELPNTHTCERHPPAPRANLRTHPLGVLQVWASLLSL